jgi:protein-disulfide isomerase
MPTQSGEIVATENAGEQGTAEQFVEPQSLTDVLLEERLLPSGILEIGKRDAAHSLLLITEHHCGYCRDFLTEHMPSIEEDYLKKGMMRLSVGILPLQKYGGSAEAAAAMLCAGKQSKGWPMHLLLSSRTGMDRSSLLSYARELEIDDAMLGRCLADTETQSSLDIQHAWLRNLGVDEVPTYFIDGKRYTGLPYPADLKAQIEEVMVDK